MAGQGRWTQPQTQIVRPRFHIFISAVAKKFVVQKFLLIQSQAAKAAIHWQQMVCRIHLESTDLSDFL